jgi:hypothetical protein
LKLFRPHRFETFGDEDLWTDILRMHEVIQSSVSPRTALSVGLKVDATVLPPAATKPGPGPGFRLLIAVIDKPRMLLAIIEP